VVGDVEDVLGGFEDLGGEGVGEVVGGVAGVGAEGSLMHGVDVAGEDADGLLSNEAFVDVGLESVEWAEGEGVAGDVGVVAAEDFDLFPKALKEEASFELGIGGSLVEAADGTEHGDSGGVWVVVLVGPGDDVPADDGDGGESGGDAGLGACFLGDVEESGLAAAGVEEGDAGDVVWCEVARAVDAAGLLVLDEEVEGEHGWCDADEALESVAGGVGECGGLEEA
jgi:hypothetical protein